MPSSLHSSEIGHAYVRLCETWLALGHDDRMAYYGALDAFHHDDSLNPFAEFLAAETLRYWGTRIP